MSRAAFVQTQGEPMPAEQRRAMRSAVRWQCFTMGYTACTVVLIALVMGESQAMKTAWIEDMLSLIPQVAFLVALLYRRRPATRRHPYGRHRAMGVGHLVAGVALFAVGAHLAVDSAIGLFAAEHPTIGTVRVLGHTLWLGWLMVGVMAVSVIGPVFLYGPAKSRLAPVLHNKLLHADADMAKADWQSTTASIVGVLGVGLGWWWTDGTAAIVISVGIVWDGVRNTRAALGDLMDRRARTVDDADPHPLGDRIVETLESEDWVERAAVRVRDEGQVLHVEAFVRPRGDEVSLDLLGAAAERIAALDWKVHDVVVVPSDPLPDYAAGREASGGGAS